MGAQVRRGYEPAVLQQQHRCRVNQGVPERGVGQERPGLRRQTQLLFPRYHTQKKWFV